MRAALAAVSVSVLAAGALGGAGLAWAQPPVPSAGELTGELQQVLNTGVPAGDRAAKLEGGDPAVPTADNIANRLNAYGGLLNWQVQNPTLNGDRLDAQLAVTIPIFGTKTHNIYWVDQGGTWKLSNASACVIATDAAGVACTV